MKSSLAAVAVAACLMLAGCFTSEKPLFQGAGEPVFGRGLMTITTYETGSEPDSGKMQWTAEGYIDPDDESKNAMTFHHAPGGGWFSPWYIGQSGGVGGDNDGYMYMLFRKQGPRMNSFDLSCSDLTDTEVAAAHLVRDGNECKATSARDLAGALRLLAKRKPSKSYMVAKPAS